MTNLIRKLSILLVFFTVLYSCKDDTLNPVMNEETNPKILKEYGTGWIPATEEDWSNIPEFKDKSQINVPAGYKLVDKGEADVRLLNIPSVFDQGPYATSTAVALSRVAYSIVYRDITGMEFSRPGFYLENARVFSPAHLFVTTKAKIYSNNKPVYNLVNPMEGIKITDAFKIMETEGVAMEASYPYLINLPSNGMTKYPQNLVTPANLAVNIGAKFNRGATFLRIKGEDIERIKTAIKRGAPVVFGMNFPMIKDTAPLRNGKQHYGYQELLEDYNSPNFKGVGGQTMTIIGYNDILQAFLVQNSWGKEWGGYVGQEITPEGCFWLKYDLLGKSYNGKPIVADFCTFTYSLQIVMAAKNSFLYEFSGYTRYPGVKYPTRPGSLALLTGQPFPGVDLPVMNIDGRDYFQYPKNTIIPAQGTLEFHLFIKEGYMDTYNDTTFISTEKRSERVPIFSTLIDRLSESLGGLPSAHGGMQLRVSESGEILLRYALDSFDSTVTESMNYSPGGNVVEVKTNTTFKFNKWNTIAISYGSEGIFVKVNKSSAYRMGNFASLAGNTEFTFGRCITSFDFWKRRYLLYIDPWLGPVYHYEYGTKKKREEGFHGYVKAFRVSKKQQDWVIGSY